MAEQVARAAMLQGKNKVLLFRRLADAGKDAAKLSFQTDHTFTLDRDTDTVTTKDGTVTKIGELAGEVTGISAVQAKGDPVADMLLQAVINADKLELWEVTIDDDVKDDDGKYPAMYAQGYLTSWETGNGAEDEATYSGDFLIDLVPQFGYATLTEEQEAAVQYAFRDTTSTPEGV